MKHRTELAALDKTPWIWCRYAGACHALVRMGLSAWRHLIVDSSCVLTSNHTQNVLMVGTRWCRGNLEELFRPRVQLDFGLAYPSLTIGFPPIIALQCILQLAHETFGFRVLSQVTDKVRCANSQAIAEEEGMAQEHRFGQQFISDQTPLHPEFRQKNSKAACVDCELTEWDAGIKKLPPVSVVEGRRGFGRSGSHDGHLEVEMCRKLCEDAPITDAVDALNLLVQRACQVPNNLFYLVLKRCKSLVLGRRIHALTIESGYEGDAFLATHLIGMYAYYGRLEEAMRVFTMVSTPDAYNWATIISAYARCRRAAQAIGLYRQMRESTTVTPTDHIYVAVLTACAALGDLIAGKEVHGHILASAGKRDIFVQTGLVDMYAKCRSLEDARRVFDSVPERNVATWNALLAGYAQQGMGQEALSVYTTMQQEGRPPPDSVTFVCLLQACASVGALHQGKKLHAQIEERGLLADVVVGNSLVNMYAKCGNIEDARSVFEKLPARNVVTWTAMMAGYTEQGMGEEALALHCSMQHEGISPPNFVTFVCLLQACTSVGALQQGRQLHAQIEERGWQTDGVLGTCLIDMYAKCGNLDDARSVFDKLPQRDVVIWNAMIAGYAQQGMVQESLSLYSRMQQEGMTLPNSFTFTCLLQACAIVAALHLGMQLHVEIEEGGLQADPVVGAALVNMYAKCGGMYDARQVFESLPERTIEACNALAAGYTRQGDSDLVFALLDRMTVEGIQPNCITFLSVLTVCSHAGLVDKGRQYFRAMRADYGISPTEEHYTCMMDLLGRAGHLDEALQMAKTIPFQPQRVVWHSLLGACLKWKNVEIGQQAFECAVSVDGNDAASYVLMSNIYASTEMWEKSKDMQARRVALGVWKMEPGKTWWTDMGGVVHTFVVGGQDVS